MSADATHELTGQNLCIAAVLQSRAERTPAGVALAAPGRPPLTYARLHHLVQEVHTVLRGSRLGRTDRVAVVIPNGPEMATAFLAVAASATCAPLNPGYRDNEFDYCLADLGIKALVVQPGTASPAIAAARRHRIAVFHLEPAAEAGVFELSSDCPRSTARDGFSRPGDTALVLHTSGTTSRPKVVPLTHANICTSAGNIATTLTLTPTDRCLNVMPLHHIHGLVGATLSTLVAGGSIVCPPDFQPARFFSWLRAFRPSWYTAVPTIHQAILSLAPEYAEIIARCPLRFIRSCSAPLPITVMEELERVFRVPVLEAYGMTEASHQIASNPLPPGPRKPGSVGVPTGSEVAIMDDEGCCLPAETTGEIAVRGPNVTVGYEHYQPVDPSVHANGWLRTGDEGYLDADGYLFINGRLKEIINRGGEKISPRQVEEVLLAHPAVSQAVAFGIPHRRLGEDVVAAVVLQQRGAVDERDIRRFAAARLADFRVPSRILIVEEIPKSPTGKVQRALLAKQFGELLTSAFVEPTRRLERELAAIWAGELGVERVGVNDNFFELGGTSLLAVRIFVEVEKLTGRNLPPTTLVTAPTIKALADILAQESAEEAWPSLVPLQPEGSRPPFFCVHGLGGDVIFLRHLAAHLGLDQPLYALRQQGLDGVRPPHTRVEDMAAHYVQEIVAFQPDGPYLLGGYSFGGLVALEMARQFHARGQQVALLALIDSYFQNAPATPRSLRSDIEYLFRRFTFHVDHIVDRGVARAPGYLFEKLMRRIAPSAFTPDPLPPQDSPELPPRLVELERLDIQATRDYVPRPYRGRVTLFLRRQVIWADQDERVPRAVFLGGIEVHKIPGDHVTVVVEPHVRVLARKLRSCLNRTIASLPAR